MKTIFITGANKGLGYETAKYLLQKGHFVLLGCRNDAHGQEAVEKLRATGLTNCRFIKIDTSDDLSVREAAGVLTGTVSALDILINNAAILGRVPDQAHPHNLEDIQAVFNTNFFGTIRVTEALFPLLERSSSPRIVNVTSTLASLTLHSDPDWELYPAKFLTYGPSKTALNAYTVALAYHYRDTPFKINCVTPGYTSTDLNGHSGGKPAAENCRIIARYALLDEAGPSGKYFGESGELPW